MYESVAKRRIFNISECTYLSPLSDLESVMTEAIYDSNFEYIVVTHHCQYLASTADSFKISENVFSEGVYYEIQNHSQMNRSA